MPARQALIELVSHLIAENVCVASIISFLVPDPRLPGFPKLFIEAFQWFRSGSPSSAILALKHENKVVSVSRVLLQLA